MSTPMTSYSNQPTFQGQRADEEIFLLTRQHPISLLLPAWPIAIGLCIIVVLLIGQYLTPSTGLLWNIAEIFAGIVTLGFLFRWAIFTAYMWWFTLYIITNQRIIHSKRGLNMELLEIPLGRVQKVQVLNDHIDEWLFRYGRVCITMAGGTSIMFSNIATPFEVMYLMQRTQSEHASPHNEKTIDDPALAEIINQLAQPDALPDSQELDPLITSHWPFSRALNFPLDQDEKLLGVIGKHWIVLLTRSLIPLGLLFGALIAVSVGLASRTSYALTFAAVLSIVGLLYEIIVYLNFADDVFLVTTRRIIDIERYFFVIFTSSTSINLKDILKNTTAETVAGNLLHYGLVSINVAEDSEGKSSLELQNVPYPELIESALTTLMNDARKREAAIKINEQRKDTREWFADVLGELIVTTPDFTHMVFENAYEQALQEGFRPMIVGEQIFYGTPGGYVIGQLPQPGTRALRGSDISFVLSSSL